MNLTAKQVRRIADQVGDDASRLGRAFTLAGIEIVPDPEPALPPRPLRVWMAPEGGYVIDARGKWLIFVDERTSLIRQESLRQNLEALVSAYNAAGEREQLVISGLSNGRWLCCDAKHRLAGHSAASKALAIGLFVIAHASDLGLEIVES